MAAFLAAATPLAIFEELRFVWEYLAAAFVLLAIQAEPKPKAALKAAGLIAGFSFVSLGLFPLQGIRCLGSAARCHERPLVPIACVCYDVLAAVLLPYRPDRSSLECSHCLHDPAHCLHRGA